MPKKTKITSYKNSKNHSIQSSKRNDKFLNYYHQESDARQNIKKHLFLNEKPKTQKAKNISKDQEELNYLLKLANKMSSYKPSFLASSDLNDITCSILHKKPSKNYALTSNVNFESIIQKQPYSKQSTIRS